MAKQIEKVEQVKANPFVTVSENLPFHDFETEHTFTGIFEKTVILGKDEPFSCNIMINVLTGEREYVKDAYTIRESIAKCKSDNVEFSKTVFNIIFEGKTEVKGKPFNKFTVQICTLDEFNEYYK
jgi:hypothetical protein